MNTVQLTAPTNRQQAYLRHLASRAHDTGMPHLEIARLTRAQAAEWIDYLRLVLEAEERIRAELEQARREAEKKSSSPYLLTPGRDRLPDAYRPPFDLIPAAFDHDHALDVNVTADDHEIVYCTICGTEW